MGKKQILLCLGLALSLFWTTAAARVYRWVDDNGVSHFSDTPPPGTAAEAPASTDDDRTDNGDKPSEPRFNFELSGVVQDPAGHPLQDVALTIIEHHSDPPGHYEFKAVRRKQRISGTFRISCQDCPIHKLRFRKTGYFSREVQLKATAEEKKQAIEALTKIMMSDTSKVPIPPQTIVRKNMVVILEPEGNAVRLSRIQGQLAVSSGGDVMVLTDLARRLRGLGNHAFAKALKEDLKPGQPEPKIRLYASPGAFQAAQRAVAAGTYGKEKIGLFLDFSEADGGIVEMTPSGTNLAKNLFAMQKAPEGGYRDRLELRPSQNGRQTYFYFKMGSFYGKGMAAPPWFEKNLRGEPTLFSHLELYMNPHGTPNLRGK